MTTTYTALTTTADDDTAPVTPGDLTAEVDLLGRVVKAIDVGGVQTATVYDQAGRPSTSTTSRAGVTILTRGTTYDPSGQPTEETVGGQRVSCAAYTPAGELDKVVRPSNWRVAGCTEFAFLSYPGGFGEDLDSAAFRRWDRARRRR